jgi:hypothetical protein
VLIGMQATFGHADKSLCVFTNAVYCPCVTGLWQVSDVGVWKLQC